VSTVFVVTTRKRVKDRTYVAHLLQESYREGSKVKHRTRGNISGLPDHQIDAIRRILRGEALLAPDDAFTIERSLPHGHVLAVLGTIRNLGLDRLLANRPTQLRQAAIALIAARVLDPASKLATARGLARETARNTLAESLALDTCTEDNLYAAMDWLLKQQKKIESGLAKRHLADGALVLYDLTSTYFEGRACPLARMGYSRDGKPGTPQIEFGLLCNAEGCPVAVEVFEGNLADPMTLRAQITKLKEQFSLRHIVLVGDRGMLTEARLREDIRPDDGLDYITCLRAPAIKTLVEQGHLQLSLFDERDLAEITSPDHPGERLIVCRNPNLCEDRRRTREELLARTEAGLAKIAAAVARPNSPLRGRAEIAFRVGKIRDLDRMGKHFVLDIKDDRLSFARDEAGIEEEAALDGLYVIRTSVPHKEMDAEHAVRAYKGLSRVETAFRTLKTVALRVRPIYHRLPDRVRAHVFLSVLAYYVEWHMRRSLAPLLFNDEAPEEGEALRESPVAPARRSPSAIAKARTGRTGDDLPIHSFRTLLADLATLTKNRCTQPAIAGDHQFTVVSRPTKGQARALELLGITNLL
jgi:hypothetical protein